MKKVCLVFAVVCVSVSVFAQTWQPATGGSWTNTANWNPVTVPDSDTAQAVVTKDFASAPTITLDRSAAFTVNKITYDDTGASGDVGCTVTNGNGVPTAGLIFAGVNPTITVGADITIYTPVNLSLGLIKAGARYVYLNGAVTGFGPGVYTNVTSGLLAIGPATAIGWTAINKTVGGGTLRVDAVTTTNVPAAFAVSAGELQLNPSSGVFAFTNITGFTKTGAGSLRFNRPADGPGGSATLQVSAGSLGVGGNLTGFVSGSVASGATFQPNGGVTYNNIPLTLTGSGSSGAQGALFFNNGGSANVTWPGAITLGSGGAAIGSYGVTYSAILSGVISGTGPLTFNCRGGSSTSHTSVFNLNAANTYTGNTTFNNADGVMHATLKLGVNNALPVSTALTLSMAGTGPTTGVTLDLNGKNQQLAGLTKNATATASKYRVLNSSATASTLTISNDTACAFDGLIGIAANANLSLIKQGNATLTLSGTNAYSGGTTVRAGTLMVTTAAGSGTGTGNVTVESGATLGGNGFIKGAVTAAAGARLLPGGSGAVGTLTLTNTLALNGSALTFDVPSSGACDTLVLSGADSAGALTLNGANTLALNLLSGTLPAGDYILMTYATLSGEGSLTLDKPYRNASLSVGANSVTLTVTGIGVGPYLTWVGDDSSNPWDINTTALWNNGAGTEFFNDLDNVTFNDAGSASPAIDLTTTVQPTSVVVTNALKAYTFSGVGGIGGAATLTKQGTNTLTLALANTHSGLTTVSGGRLVYGINDALGTGAVIVSGTGSILALGSYTDTVGTVTLDTVGQITGTSGTLSTLGTFELKSGTVSAILAGSGALNQTTPSTVTLSGSNTYSGATTIGINGVSNTVLAVNNNWALGSTASGTTINGGYLVTENRINLGNGVTVTDETLIFASANGYRAGLHYTPGSGSAKWDGNIVLSGAASYLTSDTAGGSLVIGDSSSDSITGTGGGFSLRGGGTVTVNSRISIGATQFNRDDAGLGILNTSGNTWGVTQVGQGTLRLGVSDALPLTTTLNVGKAGALALAAFDLNGNKQAIASLGEFHFAGGTQRIISSTPATLIVGNSSANTFGTTGSSIEGAVSIVKSNTGTLTLTGTNTYSGATIVSNGTLVVSSTGMLGNSTNIVVAAGTLTLQNSACITNTAVVQLMDGAKISLAAGVNETVGRLYFNDTPKAARTYGATGSGASLIDDTRFAGTGLLTVLHGNSGTVLRVR